ncbi:MAG: hypothetical protein AB1610_01160 [Nitrospirota bacterium]
MIKEWIKGALLLVIFTVILFSGNKSVLCSTQPSMTETSPAISTESEMPSPSPAYFSWVDYIKPGKSFQVILDVAPTKFDDSDWLEKNDPMGPLKGGETYTVIYNPAIGWTVSGYNEETRGIGTWTYQGSNPENFQLNLWGRVFCFSKNGEIFDYEYGIVGHLIK